MVKNKTVQLLFVCFLLLISSCSNNEEDKYNLIPVKIGDSWGYINQSGEIVINPQFGSASIFTDGLAAVSLGDKSGFINDKGEYIISPIYKEVTSFSAGIAWTVKENGYPIAIDKKGNELFLLKEAVSVGQYEDGLARFSIVNPSSESSLLYGYVDTKGEVAIAPTFEVAFAFSDGLAEIIIDGKCGFIDTKGKIVITPQFDRVHRFVDGRCIVSVNNSYGVIDEKGKFIINPQFDLMIADDDLYRVIVGGKFGWCDDKGKFVINPQFQETGLFNKSGLAPVLIEGKYGFIDKTGKIVINPQFERASYFLKDISAVQIGAGKNRKWGFIDKKGIYIVNPQFSAVDVMESESVTSDYFNVETIISSLINIVKDGAVDEVNFNTQLSDIMDRYSLKENDFKSYNSSHKLKTFTLSKDADLEFKIEGNMHNRVYSGWGYEDTLIRNATPKAFTCQIILKDKGFNKQGVLYAELKKAFKLDDNGVCKIGKSYLHFEVGYTNISLSITPKPIGIMNSESIAENEDVVIEVGEAIAYAGKINGKHPITMNLTYGLDNLVSGTYQYTAYKLDISLEGSSGNGYMTLTESTNGKVTGTFSGQTTGGTYSGTWTSIDGKRTMPFSVTMK